MKTQNKRLSGILALVFAFCILAMPLMGMASAESISANEVSVCICETKCTKESPNQECVVCRENAESCQGSEAETDLLPCLCEAKCTKDNHNTQCPACAFNLDLCIAPPAPPAELKCICTEKCTADRLNEACEVCKADIVKCVGKEPNPPEIKCICTEKCVVGAMNEACEVCKSDLTKCTGKETEKPEAEPKFMISIQAPDGWYTKKAEVIIHVKDENNTGWEKVEAKINSGGSWTDLTDSLIDKDRTSLEISENCTVYVTVTDKLGKNHTKNKYIEVFDREAPTVRAGIDGELLRVEADDDLSGVERIYICGNSFSKLDNGTLDIRLRDYADEYEKITVQAKDEAGNKSRMTQLKNPFYGEKENDKSDEGTTSNGSIEPSAETSASGVTGIVSQKTDGGQGGKATGTLPSASSGTSEAMQEDLSKKNPSSTKPTEEKTVEKEPFTPTGSATVIDSATEEQGKEFYTIMTPDENVFYLVIDKQRDSENVYFLNAVTEKDLMALAQKSEPEPPTASVTPEEPIKQEPQESEIIPSVEEPEKSESKSDNNMIFIVLAAILAAGGIGYYLKVYKPKHELDGAEDIDDFEFEGPEEEMVNEDEKNITGVEDIALGRSEGESEQEQLYEENQEEIPIEENSDDDLIF